MPVPKRTPKRAARQTAARADAGQATGDGKGEGAQRTAKRHEVRRVSARDEAEGRDAPNRPGRGRPGRAAAVESRRDPGRPPAVVKRVGELLGVLKAFDCNEHGTPSLSTVDGLTLQQAGLTEAHRDALVAWRIIEDVGAGDQRSDAARLVSSARRKSRAGKRSMAGRRFGLTAEGVTLLHRLSELVSAAPAVRPRWDRARRELWLGDVLVKRFRRAAKNQELILSAFEEQGWPECIDDPLSPKPGLARSHRLHDAINRLHSYMREPLIHFHGDGSGRRICWRPVSAGPKEFSRKMPIATNRH